MTMAMLVAVLAVFAFGMVTVFPGSIKLRLVERVGMDDSQIGKSIMVWQAMTLTFTIVVGPLLDRWGHKPVLITGFLLVGFAMCLFAPGVGVASLPVPWVGDGFAGALVALVEPTSA